MANLVTMAHPNDARRRPRAVPMTNRQPRRADRSMKMILGKTPRCRRTPKGGRAGATIPRWGKPWKRSSWY